MKAVRALLTRWEELGGWIGHGAGQVATRAFLMLGEAGAPGRGIWPLTLYPGSGRGGTAEVVFQHLAAREPFTERALRAELLRRLNARDHRLRPRRLLRGVQRVAHTQAGAVIGTVRCMPPEQALGELDVTQAAGVCGSGTALLYAATGHYPYDGARSHPFVVGQVEASRPAGGRPVVPPPHYAGV